MSVLQKGDDLKLTELSGAGFRTKPSYFTIHHICLCIPSASLSCESSSTSILIHTEYSLEDSLRRGFYAALKGPKSNLHVDTAHVRHCIDCLRQSLLCAADTNMETIDMEVRGVTGWGPRKCRDIDGHGKSICEFLSANSESSTALKCKTYKTVQLVINSYDTRVS